MHILFVLDYFHPYIGGIETLFDDVTHFCQTKGDTITVLTSHHDKKLPKIEKRNGVTIHRIGTNRITLLWHALRWGFRHRTLLQPIDHIHTSTFTASISAWLLSKWYKKTCTITIHEIYDTLRYHLKGKNAIFYIRFEWLVLKLQWDHIVTVSQYTKQMIQDIHHVSAGSLSVISNQIDTNFWNKKQVDTSTITKLKTTHNLTSSTIGLFVGRLGYEKGLPYLIEAMKEIINIYPLFKLVVIAPKTPHLYSTSIQQQIKATKNHITDNQLNNHIIWIDPVSDEETLRAWMATADLGIVPSMSEGFCYTAVQMQAMGLPLIVSEVGALPEVLNHDTSIFVPYGKISLLAETIINHLAEGLYHTTSSQKPSSVNYKEYYNLFQQFYIK